MINRDAMFIYWMVTNAHYYAYSRVVEVKTVFESCPEANTCTRENQLPKSLDHDIAKDEEGSERSFIENQVDHLRVPEQTLGIDFTRKHVVS
jgi:hypothetical protein